MLRPLSILLFALLALGCSEVEDLADLAIDPPQRKTIDTSLLGVNNFYVNSQFGSIDAQTRDIRDTLGLRYVRILVAWTNGVQPTPATPLRHDFLEHLLNSIPAGVDLLVVLYDMPDWMADSANWIGGNPRQTWVERFLRPTVQAFSAHPRIIGWEIWNEPDLVASSSHAVLGFQDAANYAELVRFAAGVIRESDPTRLVVPAATQSIQQDYPTTLQYNKRLRDLGVPALVDVWNVHYYGENFESVVREDGVRDFLVGLNMPIWITESGETGVNEQLAYGETVWPFLKEEIPTIERIYIYEYGSTAAVEQNFGLRTTDPNFPVSDLYVHLRERAAAG